MVISMRSLMRRRNAPGQLLTIKIVDIITHADTSGTRKSSFLITDKLSAGQKVGSHFLTMEVPHKPVSSIFPMEAPASGYISDSFLSNIRYDDIQFDTTPYLVTPDGITRAVRWVLKRGGPDLVGDPPKKIITRPDPPKKSKSPQFWATSK